MIDKGIKITNKEEVDVMDILNAKTVEYVKTQLKFPKFTPPQEWSIRHFLQKYDCIVQAPTGSGKTLAYGLPMMQILDAKKEDVKPDDCHVLGLVLAPSKELVTQVSGVLKPLAQAFDINVVRLIGGGGSKTVSEKPFKGNCIVVATPGRLDHVITKFEKLKKVFRYLEMLIIDEADRFSDEEFKVSISNILGVLPKQRLTGLFSATQAKEVENMLKFGIRNPIRAVFSHELKAESSENMNEVLTSGEAAPAELTNYYTVNDADQKVLALVNFLNGISDSKILVFMSNASEVEYFSDILPLFLENAKKRPVMSVHRKKYSKRQGIIKQFSTTKKAILLCTDLMARGLDIPDIDWVVQFDIPKQTNWFVHRSGRTARQGKQGKAIVFLNKEEEAYVDFVSKYENLTLNEYKIDGLTKEKALDLREKIRELAKSDRKILLNGTRAFVAFIQFYIKHDCKIVCKLGDQDIPGIAHAFGLLRMPVMKEFRGRKDLKMFENAGVPTVNIAFKDEKLEAQRQVEVQNKRKALEEKIAKNSLKRKSENVGDDNGEAITKKAKKVKPRKQLEWDELQNDERLLKKFKSGKITKEKLRDEL
ncbi:unnamed protein product [Bursaphelenchus xylophilus]|uniref:ATP-dependent RNA helicase n=1 Tax=Bursaphelenchus xylophilus TaxID=6326 RepID=A0A1I7S798_BURXY|nr:unnamed protein product [Bursaphelenchus xylophilus]CAG9084808.1 unnamed protein product [Bursaphelenchus xylophilus]